jgi:hypothetical protein
MTTAHAFQIHADDNVATLLDDAAPGDAQVLGAHALSSSSAASSVRLLETVARGHKVALRDIASGEPVIKFGLRIGHATKPIARGAWVHLHNLASDLDTRSGTLDLQSGAPTDTDASYV